MPSLTSKAVKKQRLVYLAISSITLLFLGLIYAFSMFSEPMIEDFGLEGAVSVTFNIMMVTFCIGCIVGSLLEKKIGLKPTILIEALVFGAGFCGTGILGSITGEVAVLYVFYGSLGGLGVGMGYISLITTTNLWFPDRVGVSSGVLMMSFGLSSLLFGSLFLSLRPLLGGMDKVLILIGLIVAALLILAAFILKHPPENIVELMCGQTVHESHTDTKNDSIFKTPIFYVYFAWASIILAVGLATIGNAASDATSIGIASGFASLLVGLVSTMNGISRIIFGVIIDKTNVKVALFINTLLAIAAASLVAAGLTFSQPTLYVPGALLCGFVYGGEPVATSVFTRKRYGAGKYAFNFSIVTLTTGVGALINVAIVFFVQDNRPQVFLVLLVLGVLALLCALLFSRFWNRDMLRKNRV